MQWIKLQPYPPICKGSVSAKFTYSNSMITLSFSWDPQHLTPSSGEYGKPFFRCHNLWESDCLELFLARSDREDYYEFNFSLKDQWNCYHLDSYRVDLAESYDFDYVDRKFTEAKGRLEISFIINPGDVGASFLNSQQVLINLTAVFVDKNGNYSYWATKHPRNKADFHLQSHYLKVDDLINSP